MSGYRMVSPFRLCVRHSEGGRKSRHEACSTAAPKAVEYRLRTRQVDTVPAPASGATSSAGSVIGFDGIRDFGTTAEQSVGAAHLRFVLVTCQ